MVNSSVAVVVVLLLFNGIIFVGDSLVMLAGASVVAVSAAVVDVNDYATVIVCSRKRYNIFRERC